MKLIGTLIVSFFILTISFLASAEEIKTIHIGDAVVVYDYQAVGDELVTLTLNALVSETNDSLRGLKNTDRRRLSKLGELIYQCKLLLYRPDKSNASVDLKAPVMISRNFSLFTGVDLPMAADELVGIRAQTMQAIDDDSLFRASLGDGAIHRNLWENVGAGTALNLKQVYVNVLQEGDSLKTAESIDIAIRFPVFQQEKPVSQWRYNFKLKDFNQAVRHADENCTPLKFIELVNQQD